MAELSATQLLRLISGEIRNKATFGKASYPDDQLLAVANAYDKVLRGVDTDKMVTRDWLRPSDSGRAVTVYANSWVITGTLILRDGEWSARQAYDEVLEDDWKIIFND